MSDHNIAHACNGRRDAQFGARAPASQSGGDGPGRTGSNGAVAQGGVSREFR